MYAADRDQADCMRLLVDAGADKNAKDSVREMIKQAIAGIYIYFKICSCLHVHVNINII